MNETSLQRFILYGSIYMLVLVLSHSQSCLTLCNPKDCSPPGSSVHGILQARILEGVAMPSSRGSSRPRDQTHVSYVSCTGRRVKATLLGWRPAHGLKDEDLLHGKQNFNNVKTRECFLEGGDDGTVLYWSGWWLYKSIHVLNSQKHTQKYTSLF